MRAPFSRLRAQSGRPASSEPGSREGPARRTRRALLDGQRTVFLGAVRPEASRSRRDARISAGARPVRLPGERRRGNAGQSPSQRSDAGSLSHRGASPPARPLHPGAQAAPGRRPESGCRRAMRRRIDGAAQGRVGGGRRRPREALGPGAGGASSLFPFSSPCAAHPGERPRSGPLAATGASQPLRARSGGKRVRGMPVVGGRRASVPTGGAQPLRLVHVTRTPSARAAERRGYRVPFPFVSLTGKCREGGSSSAGRTLDPGRDSGRSLGGRAKGAPRA